LARHCAPLSAPSGGGRQEVGASKLLLWSAAACRRFPPASLLAVISACDAIPASKLVLWSAAACRRFPPASLLAVISAWGANPASKLACSKAAASRRTPKQPAVARAIKEPWSPSPEL